MNVDAALDIRARATELGVQLDALPRHVAIIMDGNGRWAQDHGENRLLGHARGYERLQNIVFDAGKLGIEFLTVYAFSAENWRRPESEVAGLMELIEHAMREQIDSLIENNVRVWVAGRREGLPDSLQEALALGIESTKNCTGLTFSLAINYGGRAEIVDAVKALIANGATPDAIDEATISRQMYLPDAPETDLMIRTAGEMRWSNFLLWQSAYAELYVTERPWPEFDAEALLEAVATFQRRVRKFGGVV